MKYGFGMSSPLRIACATNDRFAPHCATMLRSVLDHDGPDTLSVYVLHGDLAPSSRDGLRRVVEEAGARLHWLEVPAAAMNDLPTARFHVECWYRILLPVLLPNVDRVLYVDADAVIVDSLRELWATDLGQRLFGAVVNPLYRFIPDRAGQLGLPAPSAYLNSGVLLMDLRRMRAATVVERIRAYARSHPDNVWPEQDALSVVCRDEWLALHPRWNVQTAFFDVAPTQLPFPSELVVDAITRPAIVHFNGPHKPWHYLCRHPLRHVYARYRRQTSWPRFELEGKTFANRLLRPLSLEHQLQLRAWWRRLAPAAR